MAVVVLPTGRSKVIETFRMNILSLSMLRPKELTLGMVEPSVTDETEIQKSYYRRPKQIAI